MKIIKIRLKWIFLYRFRFFFRTARFNLSYSLKFHNQFKRKQTKINYLIIIRAIIIILEYDVLNLIHVYKYVIEVIYHV